ncbi:hypothetical protein MPL1032_30026 [Mesorhizobium plurifarium]|uniref:Uncharacterized protein n=1 Tax=Mesorhizobium plurifarium TaxID=69974 RepID=A0A0K2W2I2_MESPL|nr:hypothetical protein MPL1032_30026 [Mesorhizobium plurifarium]
MALRWHLRGGDHGPIEQNLALLRCNMHKRAARSRSAIARRFWDDGIGDDELNWLERDALWEERSWPPTHLCGPRRKSASTQRL